VLDRSAAFSIRRVGNPLSWTFMGCLHDPANVQQTSSKCIQNTRANAGRLLEVCWTLAGLWIDNNGDTFIGLSGYMSRFANK